MPTNVGARGRFYATRRSTTPHFSVNDSAPRSECRPATMLVLQAREIVDEGFAVLAVLQPDEEHLRALHHRLRIAEVFVEDELRPSDAGMLHRVRIRIFLETCCGPADDARQGRAELVDARLRRMA